MYVHWLNPGYQDRGMNWDRLGLVNRLLALDAVIAMRDGKTDPEARVQELRDYILGWATHRDLLINRDGL
jgi:hypothetical protein